MRENLRAFVLVLSLCAPAYAGDIPMPPGSEPPPPNMTAEEQCADGGIQNGTTDGLAGTVLSMIESLLALL